MIAMLSPKKTFQSTLPARGATLLRTTERESKLHFNPRSPHGERHPPNVGNPGGINFNPRSPHGERQTSFPSSGALTKYFNPRSPHGERLYS